MPERKIVLFGGSFDPVHLGHVAVAEAASKCIGSDTVIFMPAKCSPLKTLSPHASDEERLRMIELAIQEHETFRASDYELKKPGPSYTLETVKHFQAKFGREVLIHWLVGADAVDDLPRWHRIEQLIDCCNLCVMFRGGCEPPDFRKFESLWGRDRADKLRHNVIAAPLIDISSTEIRRRLGAGMDVSGMLNPAVADYICKKGLYTPKPGG